MATGGRVVHHLEHLLPDPRNTVVLTGYQAVGTRGGQLLEGARDVKIHGRYVPVRAEVVSIDDFSVHSDAGEILDVARAGPAGPGHGVRRPRRARRRRRRCWRRIRDDLGWNAVVPTYGERVLLD